MTRRRITAAYLRRMGACEEEIVEFARRFPRGIRPASTDAGRRRQARRVAGLSVQLAAERLFAEPALAAYKEALAADKEAIVQAWAAGKESIAQAWAACEEARAIAFLRIAAEGGLR